MASTTTGSTPPEPDGPAPQLLLLRVGGRTVGCALEVVRELLVAGPTTRLPGAPAHVLGLLNVRGRLVTVLDVARALDPAAPLAAGGHVLVVEADERVGGCRVDAVLRVVPAPPLAPRAVVGNPAAAPIVLGFGEVAGERVTVLDLPRLVRWTLLEQGER